MDLLKSIQTIGMNETEAKIYLALIKHKNLTAVKLAKEIGIHRRTIYDNLDLLIQKGFVTYKILNGIKYFNANHPNSLKEFIEEKESILKEILPTLIKFQKTQTEKVNVNILMGKQGTKTIIENAVQAKKEVYWMGGGLRLIEFFKFSKYIQQKAAKLKIKLLQPKIPEIKKRLAFLKNKKVKFLPPNFQSSVGFIIYGNTLAIGQLKDTEIISIIIESKEFAETFRKYFDLIWSSLK